MFADSLHWVLAYSSSGRFSRVYPLYMIAPELRFSNASSGEAPSGLIPIPSLLSLAFLLLPRDLHPALLALPHSRHRPHILCVRLHPSSRNISHDIHPFLPRHRTHSMGELAFGKRVQSGMLLPLFHVTGMVGRTRSY